MGFVRWDRVRADRTVFATELTPARELASIGSLGRAVVALDVQSQSQAGGVRCEAGGQSSALPMVQAALMLVCQLFPLALPCYSRGVIPQRGRDSAGVPERLNRVPRRSQRRSYWALITGGHTE